MTSGNKTNDEPLIIGVTVNGVDLPVQMFTANRNEDRNAQVAEALEEVEAAETPDFIISTVTGRL